MARITTIDSLKKALKVAKNQVTIQDLLNERINLKTTGYSKIILTDDFRELLLDSTMQALNSNSSKVRAVINRGAQHWGLDRIFKILCRAGLPKRINTN